MSAPKFTPGEWEDNMQIPPSLSGQGSRCVSYIVARRGNSYTNIADVCDSADISEEEARANARLIAASKALLEALEAYVSKFGNCGPTYDAARAAIARALGDLTLADLQRIDEQFGITKKGRAK